MDNDEFFDLFEEAGEVFGTTESSEEASVTSEVVEEPKSVPAKQKRAPSSKPKASGGSEKKAKKEPSKEPAPAEKPVSKSKKGKALEEKKSKKPFIFIGVAVVLIAIVVGVVVRMTMFTEKDNFYDVAGRVMRNDNGHFRYTLDVRTTAGESVGKEISIKEIESLDSEESGSETANTEQKPAETQPSEADESFTEWSGADGAKSGVSCIDNYSVSIEGYTNSINNEGNYDSEYEISISTELHSGVFTTMTTVGGQLYINVEQIVDWMRASGDSYLVKLSESMPTGAKYFIVDQNKLIVTSGYAETGEPAHLSSYKNGVLRWKSMFESIINTIGARTNYVGCSSNNDTLILNLSGDKVVAGLSSLLDARSDFYDELVKTYKSAGLGTDKEFKQLAEERDNFIKAGDKLAKNLEDKPKNVTLTGKAMDYTTDEGVRSIEASLTSQFFWNGNTYTIALGGTASSDKKKGGIKAPDAEDIGIEQSYLWGLLTDVADYFNISGYALKQSTLTNVSMIRDDLLDSFVTYVNGNTDANINKLNAKEFIQKYAQFSVTESTTDKDRTNAELVQNFIAGILDITGNVVVKAYENEDVETYPLIEKDLFGVRCRFKFSESEYNPDTKLGVVNITIPKTSESCDTTKFSLRTLAGSVYNANDNKVLQDAGTGVNLTDTEKAPKLGTSESTDVKLCFVMTNGIEVCDLYYGSERIGTVVTKTPDAKEVTNKAIETKKE